MNQLAVFYLAFLAVVENVPIERLEPHRLNDDRPSYRSYPLKESDNPEKEYYDIYVNRKSSLHNDRYVPTIDGKPIFINSNLYYDKLEHPATYDFLPSQDRNEFIPTESELSTKNTNELGELDVDGSGTSSVLHGKNNTEVQNGLVRKITPDYDDDDYSDLEPDDSIDTDFGRVPTETSKPTQRTTKDSSVTLNSVTTEDDEESRDLDHEMLKTEFLNTVDSKFRSLVFNPAANSNEKFQACVTPLNETGSCRYVQHCLVPSIVSSVDKFMDYVCIIEDRYIGVCCAEHPVSFVSVKWNDPLANYTDNSAVVTPRTCGVSSKTRIVGGSKADPKDWPWMAALLTMSSGQFFCGGALINSRYVLTAAHCTFRIPKNQILVRLGEYDFTEKEESQAEDYPVVEIKRHGQYSRRTLKNDIALLKLQRPAVFGKNLGTICLPKKLSYAGKKATLAGWGNTVGGGATSDVLLEATFPVLDNKKCADEHGVRIPDTSICTKSTSKDKGACNGDSGGPLMLLDQGTKLWNAIGVVSWGRRGCNPKFPTVYTRVSEYLDWIKVHAT